jgi:tagatose 1,6-diphosphate aldolase
MDKTYISAGKLKGLMRITDESGRFRMLAIDQRGSLQKMLSNSSKREAGFPDLVIAKRIVTLILSPYFSATLMDPEYGIPESLKYLNKRSGLLVATEKSGTEASGYQDREKKTTLIEGWSVKKIKKLGADAAKLLLYYRPDGTSEIKNYQESIVKFLGEECKKEDIPFVLEPVTYPFKDDEVSQDSLEFVKRKPELVMQTAKEFSKEEYGVDLLKMEFPINLKYVKEFRQGYFDGKEREEIYSIKDAEDACYEITRTSRIPWVILSAGVDIEEFVVNVEIASRCGASGFLAGRAIWKDFTKYYPSEGDMIEWLLTSGVSNYYKVFDASKKSTPFFEHKLFKSLANISVSGTSENWYKEY